MRINQSAFLLTLDVAGQLREYVLFGRDLPTAAKRAVVCVHERHPAGSQVQAIRWLAPALMGREGNPLAAPAGAAPVPTQVPVPERRTARHSIASPSPARTPRRAPAPTNVRRVTRADQLAALLGENEGQLHISEIATALGFNRANVQNTVVAALKQGLVRRVGSRTGLVALVQAGPLKEVPAEVETSSRPPPSGLTRTDQLLEVLRQNGGEAHTNVIAKSVGISVPNARNKIVLAIKRGLVRRVGHGTGVVALVVEGSAAGADVVPAVDPDPDAAAPVLSAPPEGLSKRAFAALQGFDGPVTAKEVASKLGCRPREAGNALVLLVEAELVVRVGDEGTARYSATEQIA